jgi:hypothetical protein
MSDNVPPSPGTPPQPPAPEIPTSSQSPQPSPAMTPRNWCTLIHASGFAGIFLTGIGHIIAPLIIWLIKREDSPEIDATGRNVLNFQISFTIYALVAVFLTIVIIGAFLLPVVGILWIIFMIIGTVKSSNGEDYIYSLSIRFL